jgi:hypothetical protein
MKEVRVGPRDTVRTRGLIEAPTAITPVNTDSAARLQAARRSAPRTPTRSLAERRSAELRFDRRQRLINAAVQKHGIGAIGLLFERLEGDFGDELRLDFRLEKLLEADPAPWHSLGLRNDAPSPPPPGRAAPR